MTYEERRFIDILKRDPDRVVPKAELVRKCHQKSERHLDAIAARARHHLSEEGIDAIANIWGVGYRYNKVNP